MYSSLRQLEKQITTRITPTCLAYSREKILLSEINQLVPRTVDWRKLGSAPPPVYQRTSADCYLAATLWNLQMFGELIDVKFKPTYEDLLKSDFRNVVNYLRDAGGTPKFLLEYCMRNPVFSPQNQPLSGYMRVFPLREDFLLRSIAQQPVAVGMHVHENLKDQVEGIYRPPIGEQAYNHFVNAVGYDDDDIILQNTYEHDVGGSIIRVPRGTGRLFGERGLYKYGIFPVMEGDNTTTEFNDTLIASAMYVQQTHMCYCPKDIDSVINDNNWPAEIREKLKELQCYTEYKDAALGVFKVCFCWETSDETVLKA